MPPDSDRPPDQGGGEVGDPGELTAASMRERLLASLLADPSALLVEHETWFATVQLSSGARILVIACAEDRLLRVTVDPVVRETRSGTLHVVAVGGSFGVATALSGVFPIWQIGRRFGLHQLHLDGKLERLEGPALAPLTDAVARLSEASPLSEERVPLLLERGRQQQEGQARVATAMRGGLPWVTLAMAATCVLLFALGTIWSDGPFLPALARMGANSGFLVSGGEVWRLLASAFLHANVAHLVVNMIALLSFGPVLEALLGRSRYLLLYGLSALGGGLASAFLGPAVSVGASGPIWGLMAAGVGLAFRPGGLLPPAELPGMRRRAAVPLLINVLYSFMPGIDLHAHFGAGLVGLGLVLSKAITRGVRPRWQAEPDAVPQRPNKGLVAAAVAVAVALAASVVVAIAVGQPWTLGGPPVLTRVTVADTGVALELPTIVAREPVEATRGGSRVFLFGSALEDTLAVEVGVNMLSTPVVRGKEGILLEMLKGTLQNAVPPGAERERNAEIVDIRGRSFVAVQHRLGQLRMKTWMGFFGTRQVMVRVYLLSDLPPSWTGIADQIVESVEAP